MILLSVLQIATLQNVQKTLDWDVGTFHCSPWASHLTYLNPYFEGKKGRRGEGKETRETRGARIGVRGEEEERKEQKGGRGEGERRGRRKENSRNWTYSLDHPGTRSLGL